MVDILREFMANHQIIIGIFFGILFFVVLIFFSNVKENSDTEKLVPLIGLVGLGIFIFRFEVLDLFQKIGLGTFLSFVYVLLFSIADNLRRLNKK